MWHVWWRRGIYGFLVGKSEENGPIGRPKIRWVYSVKMSLKSGMEAWNGFIWL